MQFGGAGSGPGKIVQNRICHPILVRVRFFNGVNPETFSAGRAGRGETAQPRDTRARRGGQQPALLMIASVLPLAGATPALLGQLRRRDCVINRATSF